MPVPIILLLSVSGDPSICLTDLPEIEEDDSDGSD